MKRIFKKSKDRELTTECRCSFNWKGNWSEVRVLSRKLIQDPNFNKPLKEVLSASML